MNEEPLRLWIIQLSDLLEGELNNDNSLEECLTWFEDLPEMVIVTLKQDKDFENFFAQGEELMRG